VVVEFGDAFSGSATPLAGYQVILTDAAGAGILRWVIPDAKHHVGQRWRLQSAPRLIRMTPQQIADGGFSARWNPKPDAALGKPYTPLGFADVTTYFPSTGGRRDIGGADGNPEWVSEWLASGGSNAWANVVTNAEASGSIPWHWRLPAGTPVNVDMQPRPTYNPQTSAGSTLLPPSGAGVTIDTAHAPALCFVAAIATGDLYWVEETQFAANHTMMTAWTHPMGFVDRLQTRSFAWSMRSLANAWAVFEALKPTSVPLCLLPQSYWAKKLGNNLAWMGDTTIRSMHPMQRGLRMPVLKSDAAGGVAPWQEHFAIFALAHMARMGIVEAREILNWSVPFLAGTGAWDGAPSAYYVAPFRPDASVMADWTEVRRATPHDPASYPEEYSAIWRAAVRLAISLGHTDLAPTLLAWGPVIEPFAKYDIAAGGVRPPVSLPPEVGYRAVQRVVQERYAPLFDDGHSYIEVMGGGERSVLALPFQPQQWEFSMLAPDVWQARNNNGLYAVFGRFGQVTVNGLPWTPQPGLWKLLLAGMPDPATGVPRTADGLTWARVA
jgi:hypothetical protein